MMLTEKNLKKLKEKRAPQPLCSHGEKPVSTHKS
jgi:hypothetical protein